MKKIFFSILALAFIFLSFSFVATIVNAQAEPLNPDGNPKVYQPRGINPAPDTFTGRTGGGGGSGKFNSLQDVGIEIRSIIETIIIPIIIALAVLIFLWGVLVFIKNSANEEERAKGRQFMLWGIIGLAVMVSVWGLVQILTSTIGEPLQIPTLERLNSR